MTRLLNTPTRYYLNSLIIFFLSPFWFGCGPSEQPQPLKIKGMVYIKGGSYSTGLSSQAGENTPSSYGFKKPFFQNQQPRHRVAVKSFYLDEHEVTVGQYREFLQNTGHSPPKYWHKLDPGNFSDYPVNGVSWKDADAYARWRGKRLPSENEWEVAASGGRERKFPWGDSFEPAREMLKKNDLFPVKTTAFDTTHQGIYDLGGSLSEWTASWYQPYPGNREYDQDYGEKFKVYRGGAWGVPAHYRLPRFYRVTYRGIGRPDQVFNEVGFRCAHDAL